MIKKCFASKYRRKGAKDMKRHINRKVSLIIAIAVLLSVFFGNTICVAADLPNYYLISSNFENGVSYPWRVLTMNSASADSYTEDGKFKIKINNKGFNRWDIQFRNRGLVIEQGHTYTVKFTISAIKDCKVYPKIGDSFEPYSEYWNYNNRSWQSIELKANIEQTITEEFTMKDATAKNCEMAFYVGADLCGNTYGNIISFDDISIEDSEPVENTNENEIPTNGIRVNQEGYFPNLSKVATLVSSSATPLDWQLKNSAGTIVAQGKTIVKGFDHSSGDDVHTIDFSSYTTEGKGYYLSVEGDKSLPFDIRCDLYTKMKYDSMKYFYHNRSGIAIEMPFADSAELVRAAGHPNDVVVPNMLPGTDENYYTLDVTGGWYDGADYGKYAGIGGIATWTLMNEYEHALYYGDVSVAPFADNSLNIPESGNGYPDILDESRYNLQTLLKMQVPENYKYAGMVHHKAYDKSWNNPGLSPEYDKQERYLAFVSTVATLNLAAAAGQGARLWKQYDEAFSATCLTAAEKAWDAAIKYPEIYTYSSSLLPYSTDYVDAEFYWAACELYVTTGKAKYLDYLKASKYYLQEPTQIINNKDNKISGCFDWGNPQGMGTITLALVPNGLPTEDVATAKSNILAAADKFISTTNSQGYGVPIEESKLGYAYEEVVGFPFESNALVVNAAIVMAYAHEFSEENGKEETKYLNGVSGVMDYILGRNPNIRSYVTGYGEYPVKNPNHVIWANQEFASCPKAPAGCLSSGPNSELTDDRVKSMGLKAGETPAEKCFFDDLYSWSTNEISTWVNAPLAWVSAYLDEKGTENLIEEPRVGDVNGDREINALDFAIYKRYLLGFISNINIELYDLDGDKEVTALDYALMKKYLLGIIADFPVNSKPTGSVIDGVN